MGGGRRENNDGEGEMKERYWSTTCTSLLAFKFSTHCIR